MATAARTIHVEILRQSAPDAPARTERFAIPYRPNMNITSLLGEIADDGELGERGETDGLIGSFFLQRVDEGGAGHAGAAVD